MMGAVNRVRVVSAREENRFITFIWSCTNLGIEDLSGTDSKY